MTIPMIWGILSLISFQLVDAYYISRLGTIPLAAITYTFPITYGIFSIFIGFGVATSSVISRLIGQKRHEDVKRITSHSLLLVLIVSMIFAAIGIPLIDPLFSHMGATPEELSLIKSFMLPYFIGTFFISMPVVGNATLRASGNAITPAIIMMIAAATNAIINPFLIFGLAGFPRLELTGAAIGTVFANIFAMSAGLYLMHKRDMIDIAHIKNLLHFKDSTKRLLVIALPVGITGMLPALQGYVATTLLSKSGSEVVAAFGAANRLEAFLLVILMALSIGMGPIIGQNWGAGKIERVKETVKYAVGFSVVWSIFSAIVIAVLAAPIAALFSQDQIVQHAIILYLLIVPPTYFLAHLPHCWNSTFNAIGEPKVSAKLLFTKIVILCLPAMWLGYRLDDVTGLFLAIAAVNILTGAAYHIWAWKGLGRKWIPAPHQN